MENFSVVFNLYNLSGGLGSGLEDSFPEDYSAYDDYGGESFFDTYFSMGKFSF